MAELIKIFFTLFDKLAPWQIVSPSGHGELMIGWITYAELIRKKQYTFHFLLFFVRQIFEWFWVFLWGIIKFMIFTIVIFEACWVKVKTKGVGKPQGLFNWCFQFSQLTTLLSAFNFKYFPPVFSNLFCSSILSRYLWRWEFSFFQIFKVYRDSLKLFLCLLLLCHSFLKFSVQTFSPG